MAVFLLEFIARLPVRIGGLEVNINNILLVIMDFIIGLRVIPPNE